MTESFVQTLIIIVVWLCGITLGVIMAERENPNATNLKCSDKELLREFRRGYRAGEKNVIDRFLKKAKDEQLLREYYGEGRPGTGGDCMKKYL